MSTERRHTRRRYLGLAGTTLALGLAGCNGSDGSETTTEPTTEPPTTEPTTAEPTTEPPTTEPGGVQFTVRIENVSTAETLQLSDGNTAAVPLSPGVFAVHTPDVGLFESGAAAGDTGLEALAEDGDPAALASSLQGVTDISAGGTFTTPVGADSPAPIGPGEAYEFDVEAMPGSRLSVATMFVQSNDLFYAPDPAGIELFADDEPVEGDVTDQLRLWDAGTEVNQEPGLGPDQAPRQSGPDTGEDENGTVQPISAVDDGYTYPAVADVIAVTLSY